MRELKFRAFNKERKKMYDVYSFDQHFIRVAENVAL